MYMHAYACPTFWAPLCLRLPSYVVFVRVPELWVAAAAAEKQISSRGRFVVFLETEKLNIFFCCC